MFVLNNFSPIVDDFACRHIYQRLRFLGSRPVSQAATLFFLAMWHGPYTGYLHAFIFEFFELLSEETVSTTPHPRKKKGNTLLSSYMLYDKYPLSTKYM